MARPVSNPTTRDPSQLLALAIGAVYTLVGILGFVVTGLDNFASETDKALLGFEINPLHNLVHLAIGLAGLALWRRLDSARTYGWLLAAGYGLAFIDGLFAAGNSDINFLSINGPDNGLHLVSAVAGVAIALWPAQSTARNSLADRGACPAQPRAGSPRSSHGAPTRHAASSSRHCCCVRYGRPATARLAGPAPWSVQASSRRANGSRTLSRSRRGGGGGGGGWGRPRWARERG